MPHDALNTGPGRLPPSKALRITGRVTALSISVAAALVAAKLIAWIASGSVAILASLADSALDLAASLTTFFAVRYAASPADPEHRYGHGKAEALASLVQAMLVAASAGLLAREAWNRFNAPQPIEQSTLALGVMALSIVLTMGLIWAQTRALKKTGSLAVTGRPGSLRLRSGCQRRRHRRSGLVRTARSGPGRPDHRRGDRDLAVLDRVRCGPAGL